jgi:hypothetical protein
VLGNTITAVPGHLPILIFDEACISLQINIGFFPVENCFVLDTIYWIGLEFGQQ